MSGTMRLQTPSICKARKKLFLFQRQKLQSKGKACYVRSLAVQAKGSSPNSTLKNSSNLTAINTMYSTTSEISDILKYKNKLKNETNTKGDYLNDVDKLG